MHWQDDKDSRGLSVGSKRPSQQHARRRPTPRTILTGMNRARISLAFVGRKKARENAKNFHGGIPGTRFAKENREPRHRIVCRLEVEADFARQRSRRDVVRAAERGQEIVQHVVVRQIDDCEL